MIMHMFFALSERRLEVLTAQFSTRLWDAIRMLQDHWEVMVAGIEYGSTPPIACLGEYREAIEVCSRLTRGPKRRMINNLKSLGAYPTTA